MSRIFINKEKCIGCGACEVSCPSGAITIENDKAIVDDNCSLCKACISICNFDAIGLKTENKLSKIFSEDLSQYEGIWIFVELRAGMVTKVSLELIGEARKLALKLGTEVSAVLLGNKVEGYIQTLINYGADNVYVIDHPSLEHFNDEKYSKIIIELIRKYKPEIFLLGATIYGRSLGPRISSALNTGLTADCTQLDIDIDKRILLQTRPAFGGDLMATIICPHSRPQMATVRPGIFKPDFNSNSRKGKIIRPKVSVPESHIEILQFIEDRSEKIDISSAKIIVAAGRGLGDKKNLHLIKELASLIGAEVGASRAIVEDGWIDRSHQVGQSGNTVSPCLYLACGISGAIQHLVGLNSSSVIIAINRDADAPIMKVANYAFVGDVVEILTALINKIKNKRQKRDLYEENKESSPGFSRIIFN